MLSWEQQTRCLLVWYVVSIELIEVTIIFSLLATDFRLVNVQHHLQLVWEQGEGCSACLTHSCWRSPPVSDTAYGATSAHHLLSSNSMAIGFNKQKQASDCVKVIKQSETMQRFLKQPVRSQSGTVMRKATTAAVLLCTASSIAF